MISRWVSGIVALSILLGTLYFFGTAGLTVLCSFIVVVTAYEYASLFEKKSLWLGIFLVFNAIVYGTHLLYANYTLPVLLASCVTLASSGVFLFRNKESPDAVRKIQWPLWGLIYTGLFPALTIGLMYHGSWTLLIYLLLTVFMCDIAAFFTGLYIGGPKVAPNISPKKTISGCIGGLAGSMFFGTAFLWYYGKSIPLFQSILLSLAIGLFSQFGDFFESMLKRSSGKKDSSALMPGHGGFLDRLDGVYFGSVVLYFFCTVLGYLYYFV